MNVQEGATMSECTLVVVLVLLLLTTPACFSKGLDSFSGLVKSLKSAYPDWSPRAILDIGANTGTWSTNVRKEYPKSKILMVEASDQHVPSLDTTVTSIGNAKHRIAVLSEKDEDSVTFYLNEKASTGNSMFQEQTKFFANTKPIVKTTRTLDSIVEEEANPTTPGGEAFLRSNRDFDFIKIDVQGAELMVLKGGMETLKGATFVQFEGSTVEYNSGGSCFYEVDELLRSNGFYLYDHSDDLRHPLLFRTLGLGQWDMLYVNPDSNHLPKKLLSQLPNFCGSSPKKKRTQELKRMATILANTTNNSRERIYLLLIWMAGLIPGVLIGMLRPFFGVSRECAGKQNRHHV